MTDHHEEESPAFRNQMGPEETACAKIEHNPLQGRMRQARGHENRLGIIEDIHRKDDIGCDEQEEVDLLVFAFLRRHCLIWSVPFPYDSQLLHPEHL